MFVPPDAKTLVGIQWTNLRSSPLADAVEAELSATGNLSLPDLPCLKTSRDFLIAAPPMLAAANGGCTRPLLRSEAAAKGMTQSTYRGIEIWGPSPGRAPGLSIAQYGEHVVLLGSLQAIQGAVDRSSSENRTYSPLLISGARLAHTRDLWVVASTLPEPLAAIFVPLEMNAHNFEGGVSVHDGMDVGAIFDAGSEPAATADVANLRKMIPRLPSVAKGLQVVANGSSVTLVLQVASAQLQSSLRSEGSSVADAGAPSAALADPAPVPADPSAAPGPVPAILAAPLEEPVPAPPPAVFSTTVVEHVKPEPPQYIHIYGLDEGVREILLSPGTPAPGPPAQAPEPPKPSAPAPKQNP
jgi:hypothetical protein